HHALPHRRHLHGDDVCHRAWVGDDRQQRQLHLHAEHRLSRHRQLHLHRGGRDLDQHGDGERHGERREHHREWHLDHHHREHGDEGDVDGDRYGRQRRHLHGDDVCHRAWVGDDRQRRQLHLHAEHRLSRHRQLHLHRGGRDLDQHGDGERHGERREHHREWHLDHHHREHGDDGDADGDRYARQRRHLHGDDVCHRAWVGDDRQRWQLHLHAERRLSGHRQLHLHRGGRDLDQHGDGERHGERREHHREWHLDHHHREHGDDGDADGDRYARQRRHLHGDDVCHRAWV